MTPATCHGASYFHFGPYHKVMGDSTEHSSNSRKNCANACLNDVNCRDHQYNATTGVCKFSGTDIGGNITGSLMECETLCSEDLLCHSYFFKTNSRRCFLSYLNISQEVPWCDSCMFSVKQCGSGEY
jgi:hypothetical protein